MAMGRDSCSKGTGFESWHHILDLFQKGALVQWLCEETHIFCKNGNDVFLKRQKKMIKEAGVGPFFTKRKDWEPTK